MRFERILISSAFLTVAGGALAQTTSASATITLVSQISGVNNYDIDLHNTGTTTLKTFWFSWIPGFNFMPDSPSVVTPPSGWGDSITGIGSYAIQFTSSTGLAGGASLDGFDFSSVDTQATLMGNYNTGTGNVPILTSYVYTGGPLQGSFDQFVVQFPSAPEPGSWLAFGGLGLVTLATRRRRLKAK